MGLSGLRVSGLQSDGVAHVQAEDATSDPSTALPSAMTIEMLRQPDAFAALFAARHIQQAEFRLHYRAAPAEWLQVGAARSRCWLGLVIPKKFCKAAVRRNLIKRVMRQAMRDLRLPELAQLQAPVLMLRLTRKLPADFRSARSPALLAYVQQAVNALLQAWIERTVIVTGRSSA